MSKTLAIVIVSFFALLVIILLIRKNKKDKKLLNPDAPDSVEEVIMDKDRRKDRI